jgi:hypothetical protein
MEEEEREEDLQEVRASLRELLLVLLASPKHGVLFSDPEYGCDKSSNPLVAEVGLQFKQCCGSESGSGTTCFWASWIRIRIH